MSFEDIRLQDKAVSFLKVSLKSKKLSHSLLFFGPGAVGKRFTALTLAKAANCAVKGPSDCCDECRSCRNIEALNHPDVGWIEPEGAGNKIRIERIRDLKRKIALKPFEALIKFFIVDKAHFLIDEAANSILKVLEEPPPDSVIILITDDLGKMLPTVKSRCQWVAFSQSSPRLLEGLLKDGYGMDAQRAHFLAHLSEGRIGRALSMDETGALEWKNSVIDNFSTEAVIMEEEAIFFDKKRERVLDIMDVLTSWYRDIFVAATGGDRTLFVNIDRAGDIERIARPLSPDEAREILEESLKARDHIAANVNPKLALSHLACTTKMGHPS